MLNNQSDALARRVDMAQNAYAFPCTFVQQVQRINLNSSASSQSVVLTGFRSGEVKSIHCWLTRTSDVAGSPAAGQVNNPFYWELPSSVQMLYAGDIYARYDNFSSPLWNLINGDKAPAFNNVYVTPTTTVQTPSALLAQWVELPFAQTLVDEDSHLSLIHI